tara:strand:+ start:102 stop:326 length:225 start_codon:yes stop_codon:yes gene_type:complete
MLNPEDFNLTMEKELRLHTMNKEIDGCSDVDTLRNSLKAVTASLLKHQQILSSVLSRQIMADMERIKEASKKIE